MIWRKPTMINQFREFVSGNISWKCSSFYCTWNCFLVYLETSCVLQNASWLIKHDLSAFVLKTLRKTCLYKFSVYTWCFYAHKNLLLSRCTSVCVGKKVWYSHSLIELQVLFSSLEAILIFFQRKLLFFFSNSWNDQTFSCSRGMNCSLSQDVLKLGQKIPKLYHWDQQLENFTNGSAIVIILGNAIWFASLLRRKHRQCKSCTVFPQTAGVGVGCWFAWQQEEM